MLTLQITLMAILQTHTEDVQLRFWKNLNVNMFEGFFNKAMKAN